MKLKYIIFLLILSNFSYAEQNKMELLHTIEIGSKENQLMRGSQAFQWMADYAVDSDENIYISDTGNNRLSIISPEGKFKIIKFIEIEKIKDYLLFNYIQIIDNRYLFLFDMNKGITVYDLLNNNFKFINDKTTMEILKEGYPNIIKFKSYLIISKDYSPRILYLYNKDGYIGSLEELVNNVSSLDIEITKKEGFYFIDNILISFMGYDFCTVYNDKVPSFVYNEEDYLGEFLGFDKNFNYYWNGYNRTIYVFDSKGYYIRKLETLTTASTGITKISPNGSIYELWRKKPVEIYKLETGLGEPNEQSSTSASTQDMKTNPTINTLTTTSTLTEPNDKNAWLVGSSASCSPMQPNHPVKAFDNNPKTMWIEAAKGPGLGEYLEVELSTPIAIDGIQIQPGCFWEEYWKQNNRVRQMTIFFDDEKYILNFQDVMKNQGTNFKQPITFSKARFVINDVYKTTNWDDTAISDIWFMKEGEPVELGLGEYAGVLK